VKYVENKSKDKLASYIENLNSFLASKVEYSNVEKIDKSILYQTFSEINFSLLERYVYSHQTLKDFIQSETNLTGQKINYIKRKYPKSFETLKSLFKTQIQNQVWSKIPEKSNREALLLLEKFNIIITKNENEFKLANKAVTNYLN
jgi:hypothetical protein